MKYFFLLFCTSFYGQALHHAMLSAQGGSATTSKGVTINQTIGQQSLIGTNHNGVLVQQGFQHYFWNALLSKNKFASPIQMVTYPNPFITIVNFKIDSGFDQYLTITVFDVQGKLVFQERRRSSNGLFTIDLSALPNSSYLAYLSAANLNYYTKIIKSL